MQAMPPKNKARGKVPVGTRLSRMEDLLIEMRAQQDVKLKKINNFRSNSMNSQKPSVGN
jgi:hypothetical protein